MRKYIMAAVLTALAAVAPAQEALQCVNPDVLNSLIFNARPETRLVVKRTMPVVADGFRAPAGFQLIGSGVRGQNLSAVVGYKTALQVEAAQDSLVRFLSAEGWKPENTQPTLPTVTVVGAQPALTVLCRNGDRRGVRVQDVGGIRYVTITGLATRPARECGAPQPQQDFMQNPMAAIIARRANLPRLSFPDTARMSPGAGSEGINMQSVVSSSSRIESPDSAGSLARLLSRQLVEQGWRRDAEWSGRISTGSTWTRRNASGQEVWGTLEILGVDAGIYDVGFTLAMRQP